VIFAL